MIIAIIQARMGSIRLPGKVMKMIKGKPVIHYLIERLNYSKTIDKKIIATSNSEVDDPIAQFCLNNKISFFRGSEDDVLDRFYQTAKHFNGDIIVRLTGDCPLIDPEIVDYVVNKFLNEDYDHLSLGSSYPEGLDVEVFKFSALEDAWNNAKLKIEREHVTVYLWSNPDKFINEIIENSKDLSKYRVTIDEPEDFEVVKWIINNLYKEKDIFHMKEIIEYLDSHPEVFQLNQGIIRNEGLMKSVEEEEESGHILDMYKKLREN